MTGSTARYHARRGTAQIESVQNELRATCDSVVRGCNPTSTASAGGVSRTVETNVNDYEAFDFIRNKFPDAQWMAVRVKVDFDVPPNRIMPMSYILIGRFGPDRELVGIYDEDKNWKTISEGPPGSPAHFDAMVRTAHEELTRLEKKVADKIDKLS
jgi:hypothetical protein